MNRKQYKIRVAHFLMSVLEGSCYLTYSLKTSMKQIFLDNASLIVIYQNEAEWIWIPELQHKREPGCDNDH